MTSYFLLPTVKRHMQSGTFEHAGKVLCKTVNYMDIQLHWAEGEHYIP